MRDQWPWVAGVLVTVSVVGGLVWFDSRDTNPVTTSVPTELAIVTKNDWVEGNPNGPVTIIEYSDFQCPACGAYYPIIKQVLKQRGEQVRFVYRHLPLPTIHTHALTSAQAAQAAGKQGKFFEMHDQLFEGQGTWSTQKDPSETYQGYARAIGLDLDRFNRDRESDEVKQAVLDDQLAAERAGFQSTPTFLLDGVKIENPKSLDAFLTLIDTQLTAPAAATPGATP